MRLGDLQLTPRGNWATAAPTHCAAGHWLGPQRVLVGHAACSCGNRGGHTTWTCRECDDVTYGPPLSVACTIRNGPDER